MGYTRYFSMAFFDFGDSLDSPLSVNKEIDRFVLIDKQIYGLYSIFGNGVVDGWSVTDGGYSSENGISVNISSGLGIINYIACQTDIPSEVTKLETNATVYIYASTTGSSPRDRTTIFYGSLAENTSGSAIKLAEVTTGDNAVVAINNNVKDLISFEQLIQDAIDEHKHRGTPSKIDLQEEVRNQLPGARLEGFDASKVTSGVFDINRLPLIDHNDLDNNGILTHAALDSFVKKLTESNKELLGEISTVNLLKTIIFLKYQYSDIDENFINELALIPGISSNDFIDFNASTANIDLDSQCISGIPAQTGLYSSIYWQDQASFYNSYYDNNVVISGGEISLSRTGENVKTVEGFNKDQDGSSITGFSSEIVTTDSSSSVISEISDQNKVEGDSAGSFNATANLRVYYTRDLRTNIANNIGEDWSVLYDELVLWVKTVSDVHDPVYMKLTTYDSQLEKEVDLGPFLLLAKDEVTSNSDETKKEFEERVIDITNLDVSNVTKVVIYTDELDSDFRFYVDNMYVRKQDLVAPSGVVRYRYSTETNVVFHSIWYETFIPDNTNIKVRVKTASSTELLSRASYSLPLSSGSVFAMNGSAVEVEITLLSTDYISTPILDYLELRMMIDGDFTGFDINTATEWNRGTLENVSLESTATSSSNFVISTPINVNGYYFSNNDSISEMDSDNIGKLGFSGSFMPISPNQALDWTNSPYKKFTNISSIVRKFNKNYLIADTNNDRILEVDKTGKLVKGYGSSSATNSELFPLSLVYNKNNYTLSIVFSKPVVISDITKICFYVGSTQISLTSSETISTAVKSGGKIFEVVLSTEIYSRLSNIADGYSDTFTVDIESGAFTEDISDTEGVSIPSGYYGWKCFIGDFYYLDGISHPIFVNILSTGNLIVGNALLNYDLATQTGSENTDNAPGIIEINPTTNLVDYSTDFAIFSDYSLGGIYEFQEDKYLVACLKEGDTITGGTTGTDLIADSIPTDKIKFRAAAIDALDGYRGKLILIDKNNNKFTTIYSSPDGLYPSSISQYLNGDILLSESSFVEASGRLVRVNSFGVVTWAYGTGSMNIISSANVVSTDNIMVSI